MTRPWRECSYKRLAKGEVKETGRRRPIRAEELLSPIAPPKWRMTGKRVWGNSLRPMTCQPERFTPLSWERRSSQRSRPGVLTNGFPWRWRRSVSGPMRRLKRWQPRFFDSFKQRSHCLRGGRGRRESWPPSFSLRRPPRRAEMGVRKIARRRTSPRRSGGNKSAAWEREGCRRLYQNKLKIQNGLTITDIFLLRFSGNHVFTLRTSIRVMPTTGYTVIPSKQMRIWKLHPAKRAKGQCVFILRKSVYGVYWSSNLLMNLTF